MTSVPFVDTTRKFAPIRESLHEAAARVIDSGRYIGGEEVKAFESEMAQWLGVKEVCGVSSATLGLFGVLKSLGVGPGCEVITTVHTAIATSEAISLTGAQVVFCDIRKGHFNIDPDQIEQRITDRTRALLPVHLYGQPADMDPILRLAERHGLYVVEDCAQAQGARYRSHSVGTLGDAGVFSFFPSKNLGGFGDGGAVTAKDAGLLRKMRMFFDHGRQSKYWHEFEGINSRLDTIKAALLRKCLPFLNQWNHERQQAALLYNKMLTGIGEVSIPRVLDGTDPVYHLYVILAPDRNALQAHLEGKGIGTGIHYPYALNQLPAYAHLHQSSGSFPNAEYACGHMLSLPMFPGITEQEMTSVCAEIKAFYGK